MTYPTSACLELERSKGTNYEKLKNWSSQNDGRTLYAPLVSGNQTRAAKAIARERQQPSSAVCWDLRECQHYPPSWVGAHSSLDQVVLGRPLQRALRSGTHVGPGAGPSRPAPGDTIGRCGNKSRRTRFLWRRANALFFRAGRLPGSYYLIPIPLV
jgi:hypothetical protein